MTFANRLIISTLIVGDLIHLVVWIAFFAHVHAETGQSACLRDLISQVSKPSVCVLQVKILETGHVLDSFYGVGPKELITDDIGRVGPIIYVHLRCNFQREHEVDNSSHHSNDK